MTDPSGGSTFDPKTSSWGEIDSYLQGVLDDYIGTRPDPTDSQFDPTSPDYSGFQYSDALLQWATGITSLSDLSASARAQSLGQVILPDGTVIPTGDLPPGYAEQFDRANRNVVNQTLNDMMLKQDEIATARKQADFENRMTQFDAAGARDQLNLRKAEDDLSRYISGLQESRNRADLIQSTKLAASPYATEGGKRSFSANDFGGALSALAGQAGIDPNAAAISYPTTINYDPLGDMSALDSVFGVTGALPGTPSLEQNGMQIPGAPDFGAGPQLAGMEGVGSIQDLIASLTGGGGSMGNIPIETAAGPWADQANSISAKVLDKLLPEWLGGAPGAPPSPKSALEIARGGGGDQKSALEIARSGNGGSSSVDALASILGQGWNAVKDSPRLDRKSVV